MRSGPASRLVGHAIALLGIVACLTACGTDLAPEPMLRGELFPPGPDRLSGWACATGDDRPVEVTLSFEDVLTVTATANEAFVAPASAGCEGSASGFSFVLDQAALRTLGPGRLTVTASFAGRTKQLTGSGAIWTSPRAPDAAESISVPMDPLTDLPTLVSEAHDDAPLLDRARPGFVVGEGHGQGHHTLVRVLDEHQVAVAQFNAFPTSVRGGVLVRTGRTASGAARIFATPLTDASSREVRAFSQTGGLLGVARPDLSGPFAIDAADFLPELPGDELVVASRNAAGELTLLVFDAGLRQLRGQLLALGGGAVQLAHSASGILYVRPEGSDRALAVDLGTQSSRDEQLPASTGTLSIGVDGFPVLGLESAGGASLLLRTDAAHVAATRDVSSRETRFFVSATSDGPEFEDGEFVRHAKFRHVRTDYTSDAYYSNDFDNADPRHFVGDTSNSTVDSELATFDSDLPSVWEFTFSQRHAISALSPWLTALRPDGHHRFRAESRLGKACRVEKIYACLTFAPESAALDRLYVLPLRNALRRLSPLYAASPEQVVSVEPSHEFEISVPQDDSVGDYNPSSVKAFAEALLRRYGSVEGINARFATEFTSAESIDAPRGLGRGGWDRYATDNDYLNAWVNQSRENVHLRLAQGFREALWAGFPPATITTHQIPLDALPPVLEGHRISSVDWALAAGTSFGGTRFGLSNDWLVRAASSGQRLVNVSEYLPTTSDASLASAALLNLFNGGARFVNYLPMARGSVAASATSLMELAQSNARRPGATGTVGEVHSAALPNGAAEVACLSCPGEGPPLLKSLRPDGSFEGSVYVVPFRAQVDVHDEWSVRRTVLDAPLLTSSAKELDAGDLVELTALVKGKAGARVRIVPVHAGLPLEAMAREVPLEGEWTAIRISVRVQEPMDPLAFRIESLGPRSAASSGSVPVELRDASLLTHRERVARPQRGFDVGVPYSGDVSFAVLPTAN